MPANHRYDDLSELEMELELEMDDEFEQDEELDDEFEQDEELDDEFESMAEDSETDEEFFADEPGSSEYAQRFFEISQQEFESDADREQLVSQLMKEMDEEFFLGKLKKGWSHLKRKGLGKLLQKGLKFAAGRFPQLKVLEGITDLAKGNLSGLLKNVAMSALAAHPAGAGAMAAMKALGFDAGKAPEENQEAWENYVEAARESYEYLAETLTPDADQPLEASRLATQAFQRGVQKVASRRGVLQPQYNRSRDHRPGRRVRIVHVRPGEKVIVKVQAGGKLLVKGS